MRQCELDACDRPLRARGLCEMHYQKQKRAGLGELVRAKPRRAEGVEALAQKGENRCCVGCGEPPWGGGMRCLTCFQERCKRNAGPEHLCVRHPPGASCYQICRCRCRECKDAKLEYAKTFR